MARHYDSTRRRQGAAETRQRILKAAMKLHWDGITDFASVAREAGCSLPTVRKHFPTREALFRDCTRTFGESVEMPDPAAIARIGEPRRRRERAISELCRIHETMFGYAWFSAYARQDSAALDAVMSSYEALADAIAKIVEPGAPGAGSAVRGLLDFLTWRALRLSGGLSPEDALHHLIALIDPLVAGDD